MYSRYYHTHVRPHGNATVDINWGIEPDEASHPVIRALSRYARHGEVVVVCRCSVSPYDPGRTSGPPEICYPPEGGEVDIMTMVIKMDDQKIVVSSEEWEAIEEIFGDRIREAAVEAADDTE